MRFLGALAWVGLAGLSLFGCQGQDKKGAGEPKSVFSALGTKDVKEGDGATVEQGDLVLVEYTGKLESTGVEFDSNVNDPKKNKPLAFVAGGSGVIEGFGKGVIGMKVGGERDIEIPYSMGYGAAGNPPDIPGYADLVFRVKILWVVKPKDKDSVEFEDLTVGSGAEAKPGTVVELHYSGRYVNGAEFDSSRKRGQTVSFKVGSGEAISGVDKGIVGMRAGGKRKLWLAPNTAWGEYGNDVVPGNQVLIYEVDLLSVKPAP
ncbi:MAG: FKBP-type peptidyl-prolyl cis-trans isomerase [Fimbriimonadaceae bacterium]|nr:FKBP-type peptidyl-prolyl cis-trans isomerase [Fimbriimonadaceae bacterium]QYK59470.1 MAG: FKBP-type peptidyl-prolyl cis-trans isomerase [Fimbriimonadaceae bacterium]